MLSPVRGFRPRRAGRFFAENVPNPGRETRSPLARAPRMAPRSASTALSASALDRESCSATWAAMSDFLNVRSLLNGIE